MAQKVTTKTAPHGTTAVPPTFEQKAKVWMQIFVTLFLLTAGITILTAPNWLTAHEFDEGTKRLAVGWIGAVIGYWLS